MNKRLAEDLNNIEEVMCRTAERTDIWQDRCIYAMARAIYDILNWIRRNTQEGK